MGKRKIKALSEDGYLLLSTLYFLLFSGLFSMSVIQITGNQLIQFQQISDSYQAQSVLKISENILISELEKEKLPSYGYVSTSHGEINITREELATEYIYRFKLNDKNGYTYYREYRYDKKKEEKEPEPGEQEESMDRDNHEELEKTIEKEINENQEEKLSEEIEKESIVSEINE